MASTEVAHTTFNARRPGSLVGVITDTQRLIEELFCKIGEWRGLASRSRY